MFTRYLTGVVPMPSVVGALDVARILALEDEGATVVIQYDDRAGHHLVKVRRPGGPSVTVSDNARIPIADAYVKWDQARPHAAASAFLVALMGQDLDPNARVVQAPLLVVDGGNRNEPEDG